MITLTPDQQHQALDTVSLLNEAIELGFTGDENVTQRLLTLRALIIKQVVQANKQSRHADPTGHTAHIAHTVHRGFFDMFYSAWCTCGWQAIKSTMPDDVEVAIKAHLEAGGKQ